MKLAVDSGEQLCLCELSDSLVIPEYKLSRHMKILRQAGLFTATKEGRWVYHQLVTNVPYLVKVYDSVRALPDSDKSFRDDLKRFQKRLKLREEGRCRGAVAPSGERRREVKRV